MNKRKKGKNKKNKKAPEKLFSVRQFIFFGFLIVLLPLINYKDAQDKALMPQLFAVSLFLLIFSSIVFIYYKNPLPFKKWLNNPVILFTGLFLLITVISSFFAVNFKESLFDSVKTFIFLTLLLLAVNQFQQNSKIISHLPGFFLASGILLLAVGYYQYFTQVLPSGDNFLPDGRSVVYLVNGRMAHKNLYSSALFMLLPFLVWGFWINKNRKRILYGVIILATLIMILLLSTRAVWLGILIAGFSMVVTLIIKSRQFNLPRKFRFYSVIIILLVAGSGIVLVAGKQSTSGFSVGDRFRSIFDPEASNNRYRLNVWDASLDIWKDNPVIGVGAGNWKLNAPYYFNDFGFDKQQLNWFRPHNDFLWVLTEKGILGFIFFLAIFLFSIINLFKIIHRSEKYDFKILALLLGGGIAGYLTISFFDFPSERIFHQIVLAVWLAAIIFLKPRNDEEQAFTTQKQFRLSVVILALLLFSVVYSFSATKLEIVVKKTQIAKERRNWQEMYGNARNIPTRFRNIDADATPVHYYHGLAKEQMKQYNAAIDYYQEALEEHPTKVQVMNNLGLVYYNKGNLALAKEYLEKALEILPNYFEALVNLSAVYSTEGKYEESLEYLRKIPKEKWDERFYRKEEQLLRIIMNEH